jgi:hypothetical protein
MQLLKRIGLAVPTLVLAVSCVVAVPAFAQDGAGASTTNISDNSGADATPTASPSSLSQKHGSAALRGKGAEMLQELRQKHKGHLSDAARQRVCEAHKKGLTTKFSHIVTNSQKLQSKITDIRDKLVAYQQSKSLTVANFDSLVAATQTAEQTSADAITALQTVTPTLDCSSTSVAGDVATFKAGAQQTRDGLQSYRQAVKDLLVAVAQAKGTPSTDNTEGSN